MPDLTLQLCEEDDLPELLSRFLARFLGAERPPLSEKKLLRFLASQQQDSWVTRGDVIICYQVSTASKGTIKVNELSC